jgi:predicted nucleotidyltransferase
MKQILKVIVGSQAHGLAGPESDFDYRGVFVIPTSELLKIGGQKTQTTNWIEGKEDDTSWELAHFLFLATKCNPTILETFLAPIMPTPIQDALWGLELRELFPHIWNSIDVYNAFRGYSKNQQKKFLDKKDTRPHKYASAYLRVLYQGVQLLQTGTFPVDFRETSVYDSLVRWKHEDYTIGEVMTETEKWENIFEAAFAANADKKTNLEPVNEFLLKVRQEYWE